VQRSAAIIDQEQPVRVLTAFLRSGNSPHALLFTGIHGVGKTAAAFRFAMALNCRELPASMDGPCGQCPHCRKIESGSHPDIIYIQPDGALIRIARIRELLAMLTMRPYEAKKRVVIISDAQAMNTEAGNALLKVLEEPPDRTILILTTDQAADLLPTIVSRCQRIRFRPLSRFRIEQLLIDRERLSRKDAEVISAMAGGSYLNAEKMSRTDWLARRNRLIRELDSLAEKPVGLLLALAEKLASEKEALADALAVMRVWFRDLLVARYVPERIANEDWKDRIQKYAQAFTIDSLMSKIRLIQDTQKNISANANTRLALEAMIVKLSRNE